MAPKRIVHIGTGPWGQNYLKTYAAFPLTVTVAGRDSWKALIDEGPDGVVICTPPHTHVGIAAYALERGIPVMIEKPLALSLEEAQTLEPYDAPILVDHLYLLTNGYQELKREIAGKRVTRIETVGTGTKSHEGYSTLWDYGPHDIAMVLDLMDAVPHEVSAKETVAANGSTFETELRFDDAVVHSRFGVAEQRKRSVSVQYDGGEASFTDLGTETPGPLHAAIGVFLGAIEGKPDERLGLTLPLEVLRVLEACERSLTAGAPVKY